MAVLVCCPAYGQQMTAQTAAGLFLIGQTLGSCKIGAQFFWLSMADVVDARNVFITRFYESSEFTHCLMIDADMDWDPRLIEVMFKADKDVCGTLYRRRHQEVSVIGRELEGGSPVVNGLKLMRGVGAGVLLIKRETITKLVEAEPGMVEAVDPEIGKHVGLTKIIRAFEKVRDERGALLSEDFSFCERVNRAGLQVHAAVGHTIGHIGPYNYAMRFEEKHEGDKDPRGTDRDGGRRPRHRRVGAIAA